MRQVPYLLIGSGRIAQHFQCYLDLLQLPYHSWSRKQNTPQELQSLAKICSPILLLISDKAIAEFIELYPFLREKLLVHCSGCLTVPGVPSAHPLMTFISGEGLDLARYQKIPFILSEEAPDLATLLPGLPNVAYRIPERLRPLYHALCVLSGNFTVILWQKIFKEFEERLQIPATVAQPYLEQITRNLLADPQKALTGPLVRDDQKTIDANLRALENDPFQSLYHSFVETYRRSR